MFKIADGREHFWQWDSNCQLIVDTNSIDKVHFCNRTSTEALVLDVYEENGQILVDVPNILLQNNWDIVVYAYDNEYTKHEDVFKVQARPKPNSYVYTETEVNSWEKLEQRMDAVEATVTVEGIAGAVQAYLEENPVEAGATAEEVAQINANTAAIEELKNADFLTNSELEQKGYITTIPEEYITENELTNKGFQTADDVVDKIDYYCHDFATEQYVDDAIANMPTGGITMADVEAKGYQTEEQVIALIAEHGGSTLPVSEEAEF